LTDVDKVWLQTWIHGHADLITSDGNFPFLNAAKREIAQLGHLKIEDVFPQQRFLVIRAKPDHPDAWLTNRLISDFVPADFVSRYIFNKQGFYKDYDGYSDAWRSHVVDVLKTTYLKDKVAFRTRLYGLTWDRFQRCKPDVFVMHPGPMNRGIEIQSDIADGPQSGILQQVTNGLAVRMAVLYLVTSVQ